LLSAYINQLIVAHVICDASGACKESAASDQQLSAYCVQQWTWHSVTEQSLVTIAWVMVTLLHFYEISKFLSAVTRRTLGHFIFR